MVKSVNYFTLIKQAQRLIKSQDRDPYVAVYLLQRRLKWSNTRLLMHYRNPASLPVIHQYHSDVQRYLHGEPPQYIIGTASFYGYDFKVNRNVLIPRPETEELVHWLLNDRPDSSLKVVDIGTGSGAIAVALKLQRPGWQVTATDVSAKALRVAKHNALKHQVRVNFKQCDLFKKLPYRYFDVIISNPPYVARNEVNFMDKSVIDFEPHLALFAKDDGLQMYKRIAHSFRKYLRPRGVLYLEMGFRQGNRIHDLFSSVAPDFSIKMKKDLNHHLRMIRIMGPLDM